jgi:hypothetical protein
MGISLYAYFQPKLAIRRAEITMLQPGARKGLGDMALEPGK